MKAHPLVADVRKARKQISLKYGNDLKKIVSHYQKMERSLDCKLRASKSLRKAV